MQYKANGIYITNTSFYSMARDDGTMCPVMSASETEWHAIFFELVTYTANQLPCTHIKSPHLKRTVLYFTDLKSSGTNCVSSRRKVAYKVSFALVSTDEEMRSTLSKVRADTMYEHSWTRQWTKRQRKRLLQINDMCRLTMMQAEASRHPLKMLILLWMW